MSWQTFASINRINHILVLKLFATFKMIILRVLNVGALLKCMATNLRPLQLAKPISCVKTSTNFYSTSQQYDYKYEISWSSSSSCLAYSFDWNFFFQTRLVEVGVLKNPQPENYETGQLFLHKIFGYRGVILFPWTANIYEKDESKADNNVTSDTFDRATVDEIEKQEPNKSKQMTYYQVLIDNRDIPFIVSFLLFRHFYSFFNLILFVAQRSQPESVTFLSSQESNRAVYSIHGLDYVSQTDVLPYESKERNPIAHDLFNKFLLHDPESSRLFSSFYLIQI